MFATQSKERIHILLVGIGITILFGCLYIYKPTFLIFLENKTYDILIRNTVHRSTSPGPIIVDLDEKSLKKAGQWPWPRYRVAKLLENINDLGASSIGVDIIFAEADHTSPDQLRTSINNELNIDFHFEGLPERYRDNDKLLADVLATGKYTLGFQLLLDQTNNPKSKCQLKPQKSIIVDSANTVNKEPVLFNANGAICTIPALSLAAGSAGFLNTLPDIDGVLRRSPLLISFQNEIYPSLALATFMQSIGEERIVVTKGVAGIESIRIRDITIPTDPYGNLLVNYHGKNGAVEYISALDILEEKVQRDKIRGRMVFVGTSAAGLKDLRVTPLDANYPGVEVHATIADNIQNSEFLARPFTAITFELFSILGWGILSTILLVYSRAGLSLVLMILLAIGMWYGAEWSILHLSLVVLPTITIITQFLIFSALTFMKYWQEEKKVKAQTKALIQAQNVSIRGLASLAETRDPETGAHILRTQHYIKILCQHLRKHPKYKSFLSTDTIEQLFRMAPLHDIGKVGVPDRILLKPAKLTPDEFEEMKLHTVYGYQTLKSIEDDLGPNPFLQYAKEITYTHQEKWDGTGYPRGLKGDEIPIAGRLMAIADVYDALISRRVYKEPFPHETAVEIILKGKGNHFDPDITDAFMEIHESFNEIAQHFKDEGETTRNAWQSK